MSTSTSNLPAIILGVIVVVALVAFKMADWSGGTDMSAVTHTANTDEMISKKQKYETHKSVFSHAGFSGSLKDYLHHSKSSSGENANVKEHSGYSGSGKDYIEQHQAQENAHQVANAEHHAGFSGSLKQYLSGNYDKHRAKPATKHKAKSSHSVSTSSSSGTANNKGYSGSVDQYLKKFGG